MFSTCVLPDPAAEHLSCFCVLAPCRCSVSGFNSMEISWEITILNKLGGVVGSKLCSATKQPTKSKSKHIILLRESPSKIFSGWKLQCSLKLIPDGEPSYEQSKESAYDILIVSLG